MQAGDIAALVASVVSVLIGLLAIALSVVFYRMSSTLSESTKEAAKGIGASVDRLEKLFDKLYADTFSMMKDTVSDMRKHIWPDQAADQKAAENAVEAKADQKIAALRQEVSDQLRALLHQQSSADVKMKEMSALLDKAINESRRVETEVRNEAIREFVLGTLDQNPGITAGDLLVKCQNQYPGRPEVLEKMLIELDGLRAKHLIRSSDKGIGASTKLWRIS
jgi:flagellar basal body-associated protein FliL